MPVDIRETPTFRNPIKNYSKATCLNHLLGARVVWWHGAMDIYSALYSILFIKSCPVFKAVRSIILLALQKTLKMKWVKAKESCNTEAFEMMSHQNATHDYLHGCTTKAFLPDMIGIQIYINFFSTLCLLKWSQWLLCFLKHGLYIFPLKYYPILVGFQAKDSTSVFRCSIQGDSGFSFS